MIPAKAGIVSAWFLFIHHALLIGKQRADCIVDQLSYTGRSKELPMAIQSKSATKKSASSKGPAATGYAGSGAPAKKRPGIRSLQNSRKKPAKRAVRTDFAFAQFYLAPPNERIDVIKKGFEAERLGHLAERMDIPKDSLIDTLRLSRATVNRKARNHQKLSQDETERVLGIESLIGQVETMVKDSGNPEGFDAAKWVSGWLHTPLPALGGKTPASYMDTVEGQKLVSSLLAMAQSGAYA
jgi:putative toxin-antitoxin system antitoxin component (TIGR02293 family)